MKDIAAWYNGTRNYHHGVALYRRYGKDPTLLAFFEAGYTDFRLTRLLDELRAIYTGERSLSAPEPALTLEMEIEAPKSPEIPHDEVSRELYDQKVLLHKKKDLLRHSLETMATDEERGAAAHRILEYHRQITVIREKEDYYRRHKQLPQEDPGVTAPHSLQHRRTQVNQYMRRYRMRLKTNPGDTRSMELLEQYTKEYHDLLRKIKAAKIE